MAFGYKAHVGVDHETGIVHALEVTSANKHDVCMTAELLTGEEQVVYGDSGYLGAEKRPEALPVIRPESEFVTKSIVVHLRASTTPIDPEHRSSAESARNLPSEPKWNMSLLL